jgi:hypothetical protein
MAERVRHLLLAGISLVVLVSCGKNLPEVMRVTGDDLVYYSDESRWQEEGGVVIRTQADWERYWDRVTGGDTEPPRVDFDSQMLLLFNAGRRFPGDRVRIMELESSDGKLTARYRLEESGVTESSVYPVHIVRVRKQDGEINFEKMIVYDG